MQAGCCRTGTLESDISSLRKKLKEENPSDSVKSEIYKELDIKTLQLEKIAQYQTRGAILRSKARWYNEGEKNTKYFLNMQKRHFNKKNDQTTSIGQERCHQHR